MEGANGPLPDFLLIGARKSGTTALYRALAEHPQLFMSPLKEPRFFTFEGDPPSFTKSTEGALEFKAVTDLAAYQELFRDAEPGQLLGEASPVYTSWYRTEDTAANIHRHVPDAKLVAVLRHPAERAWSEYNYQRQYGNEPCESFRKALDAEELPERADYMPDLFYFRTGLYASILKTYYARFPRQQIYVFLYEEWAADPVGTLRELQRFLGVDTEYTPPVRRHNTTHRLRSRALDRLVTGQGIVKGLARRCAPRRLRRGAARRIRNFNRARPRLLDRSTHQLLTERYRGDIQELQELVGRDLSHWLR